MLVLASAALQRSTLRGSPVHGEGRRQLMPRDTEVHALTPDLSLMKGWDSHSRLPQALTLLAFTNTLP